MKKVKQKNTNNLKKIIKLAKKGDAEAQRQLGSYYYYGNEQLPQSYDEAMKWYFKAAEQGYDQAQYNLACCYYNGNGIEKSYIKAEYWCCKAADQGHIQAQAALAKLQFNVAVCYDKGEQGLEQSYEKAIMWFGKASDRGHVVAKRNLAISYYIGRGIEESYKEAADLFFEAASLGDGPSQHCLAECYYFGHGVTCDLNKAKYWAEEAQKNGIDCEVLINSICLDLYGLPENHSMTQYVKQIISQNLSSTELYIKIEMDLKEDFGDVWDLLESNIKTFLITSMLTYLNFVMLGKDVYEKLDFSASVLPMCKALENELYKYFFKGYINYLIKKGIPAEDKQEREITYITKYGTVRYHNLQHSKVREKFTLGKIRYICGIYNQSVDSTFLDYFCYICKQDSYNDDIEMFITNFCDDCNDICEIYRNKAAHSDIISHDKAADCGAHLIKVKKMIREFVEKIDFEKAKEYTEC